jgi:hypothetical protein
MNFIVETVVKKAIAKVVGLLVPGGAFIQAIISIYDTVMVFIAKLKKIIQVAMAFLDSMMAIANGVIGAAAAKVESTLAGLLVLAISFLAGFLGLNKIADKVMDIINTKVRAPVDKAIDFVINWIVTTAKNLFKALFGKKDAKPDTRTDAQKVQAIRDAIGEINSLRANPEITQAELQKKLPSIQARHKITALTVVPDGEEGYHVHAAINPEGDSGEFVFKSKFTVDGKVPGQLLDKYAAGKKIRIRFYGLNKDYSEEVYSEIKRIVDRLEDPKDSKKWIETRPGGTKVSVPKSEATVEHDPSVADHWNSTGRLTHQEKRRNWANFVRRLKKVKVLSHEENSRQGASRKDVYLTDVGKNFRGPGEGTGKE